LKKSKQRASMRSSLLQRRLKSHNQVKDEMARFMAEVAPAFSGAHKVAAE